ncbi:DnaD domain protein [Gracilibacillus salitolerans]|uniref:DnaD domain protein n=1 Tax=Gracilibacillus salitolerans TaxID=2663022 RepID=A0A5Q2TJQ2_9BACI|nr:DnaD domain protein [Gracilibacillus salitolerans]QGH35164.1 DnaD domain protein [Gracilibacillus salitolerans]
MAKFRQVHVSFWNDPKVMEEMTPEDKYFYLYLLTNPNTKQIGVYQITKKQMAFDLGYSVESINSLLDRFINNHQIIKYNDDTREICILNWAKYNLIKAGKPMLDLIRKELKEVKDVSLLADVCQHIENESIKNEFLRYVDDTSEYISTSSRQEKEEQQEEEKEGEIEQQQEEQESPVGSSQNSFKFYEQNFGMLTPFIAEDILKWIDDLSEELVIKALTIAQENQKPWKYAKSILKAWASKNVKSLNDVEALEAQFKRQQQNKYGKPTKADIIPDWYEKQKQERSQLSKIDISADEKERIEAETDQLLEEYLANTN